MVTKQGKVTGIVTPFDLINILVSPKEKFDRANMEGNVAKTGNVQKIHTYAKSFVESMTEDRTVNDALGVMLEKNIGSVVIVDESNQPLGIITLHDLFLLLRESPDFTRVTYVGKNVAESSQLVVNSFIEKIEKWLDKNKDFTHARLVVKEERNGELYEVTLDLIPAKGKSVFIKKEGKELPDVLHKIKLGYEE
jgi:CBS domain-containing protein